MITIHLFFLAAGFFLIWAGCEGWEYISKRRRPKGVAPETWSTLQALARTYRFRPISGSDLTVHYDDGQLYWGLLVSKPKPLWNCFTGEGQDPDAACCDLIKKIMRYDWSAYEAAAGRLRAFQSGSEVKS